MMRLKDEIKHLRVVIVHCRGFLLGQDGTCDEDAAFSDKQDMRRTDEYLPEAPTRAQCKVKCKAVRTSGLRLSSGGAGVGGPCACTARRRQLWPLRQTAAGRASRRRADAHSLMSSRPEPLKCGESKGEVIEKKGEDVKVVASAGKHDAGCEVQEVNVKAGYAHSADEETEVARQYERLELQGKVWMELKDIKEAASVS